MGEVTSTCCQNTTHLQQANLTRQISMDPISYVQQVILKQQPFQPVTIQIRQTIRQAFKSKYLKNSITSSLENQSDNNNSNLTFALDNSSKLWTQQNILTITRKRPLPAQNTDNNHQENVSQRSSRSIFNLLSSEPTEERYSTYIKPIFRATNNNNNAHNSNFDQSQSLTGVFLIYFPNKQYYFGQLSSNQPTNGIFIFKPNCYYVGNIKNLHAQGQGQYLNKSNGYFYQGNWSKNLQHGKGKQIYLENGDIFEGEFMYGSKFGQGKYSYKNGTLYVGYFYNGMCDGYGKLTVSKSEWYAGEWKLGSMQGRGQYHYTNGDVYFGEFQNGKKHGNGRYVFSQGYQYDGEWYEGKMHGKGIIKQGYDEIQGQWNQGVKIA